MKVVSLQLPSNPNMERLPLPFSPTELLWRYPLPFAPPPPSPLADAKAQLPASLPPDPRTWNREDVALFLKWCEREFDLPNFDMDMFQMNGKALCLLTKTDLGERCPGAGDVLHNVLQMLIRDAALLGRCMPSSPVTPTSRTYPLSPHSHPPTPTWASLTESAYQHAHFNANSITLSPAPSVDSQAGSPQRPEPGAAANYVQTVYGGASGSSGSNQSDSDEEAAAYGSGAVAPSAPPPRSPKDTPLASPAPAHPHTHHYRNTQPREFFPSDMPEPNTNGRLLWDFLQQLLNDPTQRYTNYIAWKNRETGVFKIVDPAGLAKLWGIQKNHLSMNYDKMSRALRYYYRVNILRKVQGERHCYQFLRNPTELKNIKNISLLRQQMSPTRVNGASGPQTPGAVPVAIKSEIKPELEEEQPGHDEEMPTDLSMSASEAQPVPTLAPVPVGWRKRPHAHAPPPLSLSDKHRISTIIGENIQKMKRECEHYSAINLKSEKSEHERDHYALNLKSDGCEQ